MLHDRQENDYHHITGFFLLVQTFDLVIMIIRLSVIVIKVVKCLSAQYQCEHCMSLYEEDELKLMGSNVFTGSCDEVISTNPLVVW